MAGSVKTPCGEKEIRKINTTIYPDGVDEMRKKSSRTVKVRLPRVSCRVCECMQFVTIRAEQIITRALPTCICLNFYNIPKSLIYFVVYNIQCFCDIYIRPSTVSGWKKNTKSEQVRVTYASSSRSLDTFRGRRSYLNRYVINFPKTSSKKPTFHRIKCNTRGKQYDRQNLFYSE